jgi:hypothetical protein
VAGPTAPAAQKQGDLYGSNLVKYIMGVAPKLQLDTAAVLADVQAEGGFQGAVGDSGTSFGPFQLHVGGRLPAQYAGNPQAAAAFANSPAGINYALQGIAGVAAGKTGTDAITNIVTRFEQPANTSAEIAAEQSNYSNWQGAVKLSGGPGFEQSIVNLAGGLVNTGLGGLTLIPGVNAGAVGLPNSQSAQGAALNSIFSDLSSLGFTKWLQKNLVPLAEMAGGGLLIAIGLVMVGRAATSSSPAKAAVGAAETVAAPVTAVRGGTAARGKRREASVNRSLASQEAARRSRVVKKGFEPQSAQRDRREARRGAPGSSRLAKGDRIPF